MVYVTVVSEFVFLGEFMSVPKEGSASRYENKRIGSVRNPCLFNTGEHSPPERGPSVRLDASRERFQEDDKMAELPFIPLGAAPSF